mmetsp:Transcript_67345/g.161470  ORF Transcript_67345/g.161470 Transcript_67345/m.161470 type:complete len:442 (-) Transcript_67345:88-1413(-)
MEDKKNGRIASKSPKAVVAQCCLTCCTRCSRCLFAGMVCIVCMLMLSVLAPSSNREVELSEPLQAAVQSPPFGSWRSRMKSKVAELPALYFYTYSNTFDVELAFLIASAGQQGLYPIILGPGRDDVGELVGWGSTNKAAKINSFVDAVHDESKRPSDVVIFTDALDVMVVGNSTEIVEKFLVLEAEKHVSIFFNAEERCFPDDCCRPEGGYPPSPTRWRYLNSGVFIGRVWALRRMLKSYVGYTPHDQEWYQRFFLGARDLVGLDTECLLLCAVDGALPSDANGSPGARLLNLETNTVPAVLHFKGLGHWPYMARWGRTTPTHAAFRWLFPAAASHFFGSQYIEVVMGDSHHRFSLPDGLVTIINRIVAWKEDLRHVPPGGAAALQVAAPPPEEKRRRHTEGVSSDSAGRALRATQSAPQEQGDIHSDRLRIDQGEVLPDR